MLLPGSDERLAELRFANKPLNAPMKWIYETYGHAWADDVQAEGYGQLTEHAVEIRAYIKSHYSELKEKQIKDGVKTLLDNNGNVYVVDNGVNIFFQGHDHVL